MNFYNRFLNLINACTRLENQLFLRYHCRYFSTDIYGNKYFLAPYFDGDINKVILVFPDELNYLVQYFEWFDDSDPCYEEYYSAHGG